MDKENEKVKEKVKEKKKLSIKDIGPSRLIILLLAGVFLLVLEFPNMLSLNNKSKDSSGSTGSTNSNKNYSVSTENEDETDTYIKTLEERLKKILAKVDGIGSVEVMITLKGSKELIILKDEPYTQESMNEVDGEGGNRVSSSIEKEESTVLVNDENGDSVPYVIQEIEPQVEGIVVIAEGGGSAVIKEEILEAAQVLFDVPAHKVKVMKMNK